MPRFFVNRECFFHKDGRSWIRIEGEDAHHMGKVLRLRVGERVMLCDESETEHDCTVRETGSSILLQVETSQKCKSEPPYRVTLYQALTKGEKFDTLVQKAVECGVSRIVPVASEYCEMRPDARSLENKRTRWNRIAREAAGQSGRGKIPEVSELMSFSEAVKEASEAELPLLCYEGEKERTLRKVLTEKCPRTVSILIGPEGGISVKETEEGSRAGMISVSLGPRILRTETASAFVLAALSAFYET